MTLEEDIAYALRNKKAKDPYERSQNAYYILVRFDQVFEAIAKDKKADLEIFTFGDFIPPTLRNIVKSYYDNEFDRKQALMLTYLAKNEADRCMKQQGFNADARYLIEEINCQRLERHSDYLKEQTGVLKTISDKLELYAAGKISRRELKKHLSSAKKKLEQPRPSQPVLIY